MSRQSFAKAIVFLIVETLVCLCYLLLEHRNELLHLFFFAYYGCACNCLFVVLENVFKLKNDASIVAQSTIVRKDFMLHIADCAKECGIKVKVEHSVKLIALIVQQ